MPIFKFLISKAVMIRVELSRSLDHVLRRITGRPRAKRSMIMPNLFLGGQYRQSGLHTLKAWGVTAVVSMRMAAPVQFENTEWLDLLHLPTIDQTAPTMEALHRGVAFIKDKLDNKGKVYIHCHHGEGRGPSMAAAYLISTGMTLEDALTEIRRVRTFIRPTQVQLQRLKEYESYVTEQSKLLGPKTSKTKSENG